MSDYLYVQEFLKRIEPFKNVLDSLRINCAAVRIKDKWVSLFTRIILTNARLDEFVRDQIIEPDRDFVALWTHSNASIESLLDEFQTKGALGISWQGKSYEVYATRVDAGLVSGSSAFRLSQTFEFKRQFSTDSNFRPSVQLQVNCPDRIYDLLPSAELNVLSRKLRIQTSPINGIEGLFHAMGQKFEHSSDQTSWEFVAVLPFETYVGKSEIEVNCPANVIQKLKIVYFFSQRRTATETVLSPAPSEKKPGWAKGKFTVPWPANASEASAYLYFEDSSLDELTLRHNEDGTNQEIRQGTFANQGIFPPLSLDSDEIDFVDPTSVSMSPVGNQVEDSKLHPKIGTRCQSHFDSCNYDDAIFNAMKVVEDELRQRIKADPSIVGVALISKAFNPKNSLLSFPPAGTEAEKEALYALFRGAIGMFKNPISHRFVGHHDPDKTYEILAFASLLVRIIDECTLNP